MEKSAEQQKEESESHIGIGLTDAKKSLSMLLSEREKILRDMAPFGDLKLGDSIPIEYMNLSQRLDSVNKQIVQVREWYNIGLTELLYMNLND